MTISIDNFIYLARQQEQRKFPRILACGVAGSLVVHSMAAVALNYLPQQMPVEVTLIDPSEIPADLRPSPKPPKPIPKKKIAKVTPTPTPSLTPTPSVKITPTPIPTPSVKITPTPTPTPSVKAKPNLTPQVVNIVMKPATPTLATKAANDFEKGHNQTRNLLQKNPNQQFQSAINPNEKQVKSKPDRNSGTLLQRDAVSSPLNNTRLAFKDPNRSAKLNDLLRTEPDSSAGSGSGNDQPDNVSSPGNGNSSQAATPGNLAAKNFDSTASESNSQSLTAGRNGRSPLAGAQSSGTFGDSASGGDNSELTFNSPGGLGGSPVSGGSVGGKKVNSLPLASAGTGKSGEVFNSGGVGDSFASDEFGVALIPDNGRRGSQSISEGNAKNNGNGLPLASARTGKLGSDSNSSGAGEIAGDEGFGIALSPGGRRGSQSAPGARGSGGQLAYGQIGGRGLGKVGEAESDVGNGGDDGSLSESNLGNLSRSRSSGIFRGGKAKGFGSGLECENDCSPVNKTVALNYSIKVSADITLNDSGKVIRVNLPNPSDNVELNNFTKDAFGKMKFKLPVSVTRRVFSVELNFQKTSYH